MIAKSPEGKQIGNGISTSKVQAAQNAAKMALEKLGCIKNNNSEEESEDEYYVVND